MSQPPQEPDQPPSPYEPPPGGPAQYGPHVQPGQYGPPPGYGQYGQQSGPVRGTNILAVLSLVFAFVFAPAGIVLGHVAKRQIRRTGEEGDQLATWGLILGYLFTVIGLVACCGWIALLSWGGSDGGSYR
ncbi:DUF4190 domain-containing protein [Micromonospora sp. RTGN7]|uniref:DUF4190 domain-containing protein n=1 Tax=Micromonospora sp. RTGN7 TaxID=3016526 RepID=UPI0029FF08A0|nr:DUF4190 domain-containing protein [Micromonospora sp. RTGN7]